MPCPDCAVARARQLATGATYICTCGRRYRPPPAPRVFHCDPDEESPARTPLDLAAHAARSIASTGDRELARVRVVLAELRPDFPDPTEPMPDAPPQTIAVKPGSSRAPWDCDIPRGLSSGTPPPADTTASDALARLAALPSDAAAVLRWMRRHASLAGGLRGLWFDMGCAFASAEQSTAWEDLTVKRGFAPAHGRRIALRAMDAWEGSAA